MEFQLDAICEEASDKGIEKALERVPDNMDATYERILNTINEKPRPKRELARKTLMWIAYARRPLSIDELAYAISIEIDTKNLEDLESSTPPEEFILDACANLISVDTTYWGARYIRFVHFSVQEFLTSHRSTTFCMGYEAHREIAQACIILTLNISPKQIDPYQNAFRSLLKYSFKEWPHHLLAANLNSLPENDDRVTFISSLFEEGLTMLTTLPKLDSQFSGYIAKYPPDSGYIDTGFKFSPAVLALIFDLPGTEKCGPISREFEGKLSTTSDHDHDLIIMLDDNLAIHYATVELDSVPVVRRLYNGGYDLNYSYSDLNRATKEVPDHLQLSSREVPEVPDHLQISSLYSVRSIEMARYMLNNGISIAPQDLRSQLIDPLEYFATRSDLVEFFQLLLDRVVDQDGKRLKGAMQAACGGSNLKAIRILVNKGFDIDNVKIECDFGEYGNALQNAARRCQVEVVQLLLDEGADINAQGGRYGNALQAAMAATYALRDYYVEVVQLLLDKGADVNAQGGQYGNALQAAAYSGKVEAFQLLLDKGADVNAQGGMYGNALQAAAYCGKVEAFQLLLDEGADVNAQGGEYGHVLQAAVASDDSKVEVIQLLLDNGADINAQGGRYGNALQAAVEFRDSKVEVIQLLLDKGADINAQGGEYGNALQAAVESYYSKVEVIQLLLDKGADVNAQGGKYGYALQAAAYRGKVEVIQLLLDKGADVNAQGGKYGYALQAAVASYDSTVELVQLLLDEGADVNAQGGKYGYALQAASYDSKVEVVQLLLDEGADVNAQGGQYGNALQAAAYSGKVEVVQLLLDKGADINAQDERDGNVLQVAARSGEVEVVQLLLDKGADVNAQSGVYGNALQAAPYCGKVEIVQLLLDTGADVNAQGGSCGNALQAAAYNGKVEVVQLLLDKGADVNAQGGEYGNVLQAAAYCGKVRVVQLLLDKGADVNAQGGMFGTVLQAAAYCGQAEVIHLVLDNGANIHDRFGKYGAALGHILALEPVGTGQSVPGDIPLLLELLREHVPIMMEQRSESEYEGIAESCVNKNRCSLDVFRGLLEERGWKRGVQGSKEEESGTLEIERELDVVGGGVERGNEDALVEASIKSGPKTIAHVWKLLGFTFLMFLLYTFIGFWGA